MQYSRTIQRLATGPGYCRYQTIVLVHENNRTMKDSDAENSKEVTVV